MHTIEFDIDSVSALFAFKHLLHSNLCDEEDTEQLKCDRIERERERKGQKNAFTSPLFWNMLL